MLGFEGLGVLGLRFQGLGCQALFFQRAGGSEFSGSRFRFFCSGFSVTEALGDFLPGGLGLEDTGFKGFWGFRVVGRFDGLLFFYCFGQFSDRKLRLLVLVFMFWTVF